MKFYFSALLSIFPKLITMLYVHVVGPRFYATDVKIPGEPYTEVTCQIKEGFGICFKYYKHQMFFYHYFLGKPKISRGYLYCIEPNAVDVTTDDPSIGMQLYIRDHPFLIADDRNVASILMSAYIDFVCLHKAR